MTLCGPAKKCCHMKYTPPTIADECRCGCGMLNGVFQILCGQFLLFVGFWFSAATVGDCQLVELDQPIEVREDGVLSNQVGLFSYQQQLLETEASSQQAASSPISCYYWFETVVGEEPFEQLDGADQLQYYIQTVLGSQWYPSILLLSLSTILALLVFLYVISYCCSTQVFGIRFFTGLFISIILTLLQGLGTYLIYASEWCNNNGDGEFGGGYCTMGRSTIFSIVASGCYFLSGLFFIYTSDYPGKQQLQELRCHEEATKNYNDSNMISAAPDDADAAADADADAAAAAGVTAAAVTAQSTEEEDEVIYDPPQQQHDDENEKEQNSVRRDINYNSYEEDTTTNKNKNRGASSASSSSSSVLEQHDYLPQQQQQQQQQEESAPFSTSSSRNLAEENDEILMALTALTTFGKSLHDEDVEGPVDPPPSTNENEEEKREIVGTNEDDDDAEAAAAVAMIEHAITYQEEEGEEILLLDTLQSQDDEPSYSFRSMGSSEDEFIPRPPSPQ